MLVICLSYLTRPELPRLFVVKPLSCNMESATTTPAKIATDQRQRRRRATKTSSYFPSVKDQRVHYKQPLLEVASQSSNNGNNLNSGNNNDDTESLLADSVSTFSSSAISSAVDSDDRCSSSSNDDEDEKEEDYDDDDGVTIDLDADFPDLGDLDDVDDEDEALVDTEKRRAAFLGSYPLKLEGSHRSDDLLLHGDAIIEKSVKKLKLLKKKTKKKKTKTVAFAMVEFKAMMQALKKWKRKILADRSYYMVSCNGLKALTIGPSRS